MTIEDPATIIDDARPIILIRGFGGLGTAEERRVAYQGFNDGTVYPQKRGENYIYEGLVLRLLKSHWEYRDATNVVGYYSRSQPRPPQLPPQLEPLEQFFEGRVVADIAMALNLVTTTGTVAKTIWVFRYYDLEDRTFEAYGTELVRLIDFIRTLAEKTAQDPTPKVNIVAHSMGGLIVRHAIQLDYPRLKGTAKAAEDHIHKVVTLGTPHQGISFQVLDHLAGFGAAEELAAFDPTGPAANSDAPGNWSFARFRDHFDPRRLLTVVGTNYRTYGSGTAVLLNRLAAVPGEFGPTYNRSDGLVKQALAQVPSTPHTFVHKCHGGSDPSSPLERPSRSLLAFFTETCTPACDSSKRTLLAAAICSAGANSSSGCPSSPEASTSTCFTRVRRQKTATVLSTTLTSATTYRATRASTGWTLANASSGRAGSIPEREVRPRTRCVI